MATPRAEAGLNWADALRLPALALALVACQLGVWTFGFERVRRVLLAQRAGVRAAGASCGPVAAGGDDLRTARWCARRVNGVARRLRLPANCVARSLVLAGWLRRRGVGAEVWFGVRRVAPAAMSAHAWVQVGTDVVNDAPDIDRRYAPFPRAVG
ncbi:MAG: lasso peptide biosynthesis B2 protein [Acidimicrobiia bacterium]|nr:lasso peptide biosynthesis B2 protein [Acidimicrobiia bacterium]